VKLIAGDEYRSPQCVTTRSTGAAGRAGTEINTVRRESVSAAIGASTSSSDALLGSPFSCAEVCTSSFSLGFLELTAVGQTEAVWRFAQLQAVMQTTAVLSRLAAARQTPSDFAQVRAEYRKLVGAAFDSSDAPNIDPFSKRARA
jgi:hypothetical protein